MNDSGMEKIEDLTRRYAGERDELAQQVGELEAEIRALKRSRLPAIRHAVRRTADAHAELRQAIVDHPHLWDSKRKTVTVDGVRVGMMLRKGRISWSDAGQVVKLIRKHFAERAEAMIRVIEEPVRAALAELSVSDLRKIGCTYEDPGHQPIIKPADSEVDKLVDKLMQEAERIESEETA